ncbi:hypothetical protein E3P77_00569 [Wallemia ichthyophaga]|uniref:Mitotic spindle assembly checkpoint protein MAD2B n=1 Tax=Wallemia ichthyophaga (strain EXF-994 / CBS 113033) TaxID=1299270 RepID=R9AHI6_WALI9|nr:Mitotic spindle assembly checkpoint protein MAD2B [Wallemia ichthyophaga EXF-994]TIA83567.1 hypothetical protein E3P98_00776 [Wallemia ichthyophaga]EOR01647.1 Mitotic spindle assembly checkpoint protein MAD2B [Wallemia ichthyophaga EXF-994]TIB03084.1 hypothetical protein E3P95_00750 [Wallemia ichthyophaga]TIB03957.1 hypothetical protein E3P94_00882 [Wallemia ichthyophaga]TIB69398.1 hypothetical protein E3P77_00569 [Wallemia ichthyophaga]
MVDSTQENSLSYNENVELIGDIIEISLHSILQIRQVYPQFTFERKQKWGAIVYKSRVAVVQSYIAELIRCVKVELHEDNVENVIILIKNTQDVPIERFIFNISNVVAGEIPENLKDEEFVGGLKKSEIGNYARSILVRLSSLDALLEPISEQEDLTFAVLLEMKDDITQDNKAWMATANTPSGSEIIPIRGLDTGIINVKLLCQELH